MKNLYFKTAIAATACLLSGSTFAFIDFTASVSSSDPNSAMAPKVATVVSYLDQRLCGAVIDDLSKFLKNGAKDFTADASNQGSYTRTSTDATTLATNELILMKNQLASIYNTDCINSSTLSIGAAETTAASVNAGDVLLSSAVSEVDVLFTLPSSNCSPKLLNGSKFYMTLLNGENVSSAPTACAIHIETGNSADADDDLKGQFEKQFSDKGVAIPQIVMVDGFDAGS